jgi:ATP-binding protein involved in chromosome partitioning
MFKRKEVESSHVLKALGKVMDPDLKRDIVSLNMVKDVEVDKSRVSFTIELTTPACPLKEKIKGDAERAVLELPGVESVEINVTANVKQGRLFSDKKSIDGVRQIIAVASGKGGVGKSTVAVNLALALEETGAAVGLMDADIYGPSVPTMMGVNSKPTVNEDKKIIPLSGNGIKIMSIGFLLGDNGGPIIWRGPLISQVIKQFLHDVDWGELDYLIIDMPPGTGDAQLTLCQAVPLTGAIIVTTPQDVALLDARKGLLMFQQVKVPVLGIIENMSYFVCSHCNERTDIFSVGGGSRTAEELDIPLLGEIPIDPSICSGGDDGRPIVKNLPESSQTQRFKEIAGNIAARLSVLTLAGDEG